VHEPKALRKVPPGADPALHLGVLGTNGLTAYFGLLDIGRPESGDTVVVSAAAGSVGHVVGQIAKLRGCVVIGVAGSEAKCRTLVDELGFDTALDYKDGDFRGKFKDATAQRIDVYFDNTGGDILGSALFRMNAHGRIVCCGAVSQYDTARPTGSPRGLPGMLVNNRVRMEGFLVFDYADRYDEARGEMMRWIERGELVPRVTEYKGLESAPAAFIHLLHGDTVGTTIVRVD
jgi:NADPH-dependent curcumin reductase CurA